MPAALRTTISEGTWRREGNGTIAITYSKSGEPEDIERVSGTDSGITITRELTELLHAKASDSLHDSAPEYPVRAHTEEQYSRQGKLQSREITRSDNTGQSIIQQKFADGIPVKFTYNDSSAEFGTTTNFETVENFDSMGRLSTKSRTVTERTDAPERQNDVTTYRTERNRSSDGSLIWSISKSVVTDGSEQSVLEECVEKNDVIVSGKRETTNKEGTTVREIFREGHWEKEGDPSSSNRDLQDRLSQKARMAAVAACKSLDAPDMIHSCAEGRLHEAPLPATGKSPSAGNGIALNG